MGNCFGSKEKSFFLVKENNYIVFCSQSQTKAEKYIQDQFYILKSNKSTQNMNYHLFEYIADGKEGCEFISLKKSYVCQ